MPRYDDRDRHGNTRLYVGRLSSRTRARDLEDLFSRYGRVRDVDMKRDFAFVDFRDPRDADEARYNLDGRDFDGSRLIVEFARGGPRGGGGGGGGGSREYLGRGPPPGTGRCFNCGIDGHWARDCKAGDWKNKCYRCGDRGHIERNCPNSPKNLSRRERSYSRSVSRSPSPRRGRSRSRSYRSVIKILLEMRDWMVLYWLFIRSRTPPAKRDRRSVERRSMSRDYSRSPKRQGSSPPKGRSHSYSPDGNRRRSVSPPHKERKPSVDRNGSDYSQSPTRDQTRSPSRSPVHGDHKQQRNGSEYSQSPRRERDSRSPMDPMEDRSPYDDDRRHRIPEAANGRSPSPRGENGDDNRSP